MRPRTAAPSIRSLVVLAAYSACVLAVMIWLVSPAAAQSVQGGSGKSAAGGRSHDVVIVSNMPEAKGPVHRAIARLLGKAKGQSFGTQGSEEWRCPKQLTERLRARLAKLGAKVTTLRSDWRELMHRHREPPAVSAAQASALRSLQAGPGTTRVSVMQAREAEIAEYALTNRSGASRAAPGSAPDPAAASVVIPLSDATALTVRRTATKTVEGGIVWRGIVEETGDAALLMWRLDGRLTGLLGHKGIVYSIIGLGNGVQAVVETDPRNMPPDHARVGSDSAADVRDARSRAGASPGAGNAAGGSERPTPTPIPAFGEAERRGPEGKPVTIDLMLLYTPRAASRYIGDPGDMLQCAIERTNDTFRNSGIDNVSLRLVHHQVIDYDEADAQHFQHLYNMVDGLEPFGGIKGLREQKRADIVGLIVEDPSGCGLSTGVAAEADEAYFVVHHSCAAITISIAHEVGHILGARHDRGTDGGNTPFPYGHGYVNGTRWRTIMSYKTDCDGCLRIPFWSNPRVGYMGEPTGTASEDNARVILEQAERVARFR